MDENIAQYQDPSINPAFFKAAAKALGEEPAPADETVSDDTPVSSDADEAVTEPGQEGTDESPQPKQDGEQPSEQEPLHNVVVNGKTEAVPLSELIAGYQRNQDYSTKSREVAAEKKAVDALRGEVAQLRDAEAQKLQMLEAALRPALPDMNALNQALANNDIAAYTRMKHQIDQFNAIQGERQRIDAESKQRAEKDLQTRMGEEATKLYTLMPELKQDDAKSKLVSYLTSAGYSEIDINGIVDARDMVMAEKARRYDELMAKKPDANRKVANAPKVATQSARLDNSSTKAQGIKEAKAEFYKNPNDDNAMVRFFSNFA